MGRKRKNARRRPRGRRIYYNNLIGNSSLGGHNNSSHGGHNNSSLGGHINSNLESQASSQAAGARSKVTRESCKPHQYEIWFAFLGNHYGTSVQGRCRPVLIVSNNIANRYDGKQLLEILL